MGKTLLEEDRDSHCLLHQKENIQLFTPPTVWEEFHKVILLLRRIRGSLFYVRQSVETNLSCWHLGLLNNGLYEHVLAVYIHSL